METITTGRTEYYLTDHLGSIRTTIDDQGKVIGYDDYYPFGLAMLGRSSNAGTPNDLNKFTGHERDQEGGLNLDYMLARNYDPEIGRFLSVDPLYNKRSWLSPYNYVQNNPLIRFDPTGMIDVVASTEKEQEIILNTLSADEKQYVKFDNNGKIDKDVIATGKGGGNFTALQQLSTSEIVYEVSISETFQVNGESMSLGQIEIGSTNEDQGVYELSTLEQGFQGITLTPDQTSNGNSQIHINSNLSKQGMTEVFSHEAYGHAYFFDKGLNSDHIYQLSPHGNGFQEGNKELRNQIIQRLLETRINTGVK